MATDGYPYDLRVEAHALRQRSDAIVPDSLCNPDLGQIEREAIFPCQLHIRCSFAPEGSGLRPAAALPEGTRNNCRCPSNCRSVAESLHCGTMRDPFLAAGLR